MDYKIAFGYIATILAFIGYVPYFRDIIKNQTKPHAFSWLVWGILTGIAFAAQVTENAGAGAWVTGFSSLVCFTIFFLALFKGKRTFSLFDWLCLASACVSMLLWKFTSDPTWSVVLITITDAIGFLPTFRKGYHYPHEETAIMYTFSSVKWIFGIIALNSFSLATWLYPSSLIIMNGAFVVLLLVRRKMLE